MMANYERVVDILEKMQSREHINYVQAELEKLSDDPLFLNLLVIVMGDKNIANNTKIAASIILNRSITQNYHDMEQKGINKLLIDIMLNINIKLKYKNALEKSLITIFQFASSQDTDYWLKLFTKKATQLYDNNRDNQIIEQYEENIIIQTNSKISKLQGYQLLFFIYKCIIDSGNNLKSIAKNLKDQLESILQKISIQLNQNILYILEIIADLLCSFLIQLQSSQDQQCNQFINVFSNSDYILKWIGQIFIFHGVSNHSWIHYSHDPQYSQLLNNLKTRTAQLHRIMLTTYSKNVIQGMFVSDKHFQSVGSLMNTLIIYAAYIQRLKSYQNFATALLKNLMIMFRIKPQHFETIYSTILHSIIFPLLSISQQETILFQKDPEQFNRLMDDCCDHQKFGILKTQASALLECICDENNKAAQYVIQHAILSLKVRFALDQNLTAQAANFLPIQTAILTLSILSYRLSKHVRQLQQLKKILQFDIVRCKLNNIQLCRLFIFFAYNFTQVYRNTIEGQKWIYYALQSTHNSSVEISAIDFISNIADNYFSINFLILFANKTINKGTLYLTAFLKLISLHMNKIPQNDMISIVDAVYQLCSNQINSYQIKKKSHTMDINACLHTVRRIVDKGDYSNDKPYLKQKIWEFLTFLPKLQKISMDDQLVRLIIGFINKQSSLNQQIVATIKPLIEIYRSNQQQSTAYLIYFNALILKGDFNIANGIGEMLLKTFAQLHENVKFDPKLNRSKVSLGTILIIFQNIIALYGNNVGQLITKFTQLSLSLIPVSDNPQQKIQYIIVARALNLLFLCHMHQKNDYALRRLLAFQQSPIFQGYDLKVLCQCLSKQIFRESDIVSVTQMINLMIKSLILSKQDKINIKSKKNSLSIKSSTTKIRIRRIQDFQSILKFINTPFLNIQPPELSIKSVIQTMKTNNPYIYQSIINSLNKNVYQKLKSIISEVTIDGKTRKIMSAGKPKENGRLYGVENSIKELKKRKLEQSDDQQNQQQQIQTRKKTLQKKKQKNDEFRIENRSQ